MAMQFVTDNYVSELNYEGENFFHSEHHLGLKYRLKIWGTY